MKRQTMASLRDHPADQRLDLRLSIMAGVLP